MSLFYNPTKALFKAAKKGKLELAQQALRDHANINEKDSNGYTALHIAALYGHVEIVHLCINHGFNVYEQNKHGETPLHCASLEGNVECIEELLKKMSKYDIQDINGKTAFEICIENSITWEDDIQSEYAIDSTRMEEVKRYHRYIDLDVIPKHLHRSLIVIYFTAFTMDKDREFLEIITKMFRKGIDINSEFLQNESVLSFACRMGDIELIRSLLEIGADPNNPIDTNKPLAIYCSCLYNNDEISNFELVKYFLEKGAKIEEKEYRPLLDFSCLKQDIEVSKLLIDANPGLLDVVDDEGMTFIYRLENVVNEMKAAPEKSMEDDRLLACYQEVLDYANSKIN